MVSCCLWGQQMKTITTDMDSVHVHYVSLCEDFMEIRVSITNNSISYYDVGNRKLMYKTHNKDTLSIIYDCVKIIWNTDPVYDTIDNIIDDCRPGMRIVIFNGENLTEKQYQHFYTALFPFAYSELYNIIKTTIKKHRNKSTIIGKQRQSQGD